MAAGAGRPRRGGHGGDGPAAVPAQRCGAGGAGRQAVGAGRVADRAGAGGPAAAPGPARRAAGQPVRRSRSSAPSITDGVLDQVCCALGGLADDDPRVLELAHELSEVACWPTSQLDRLEAAFLLMAQALPAGRRCCAPRSAMLTDALRPQRLQDAADRAHRDRGLTLTPHPDRPGGHVCGDLDAECFELVHTALTACAEADPDNPRDTEALGRRPRRRLADRRPHARRAADRAAAPARRVPVGSRSGCTTPSRLAADGAAGQRGARIARQDRPAPRRHPPAERAHGRARGVARDRQHRPAAAAVPGEAVVGRRLRHPLRPRASADGSSRPATPNGPSSRTNAGSSSSRPPAAAKEPAAPEDPAPTPAASSSPTTSTPGPARPHVLAETVWLCESTHAALHRGATITLKDGRRLNADGWVG